MKMNSLFALIAISVLPGCSLGYSPIIDGALSELEIEVVDDEGSAVADARVDVLYYVTPEKVEVDSGRTDDSGHFRSSGRTIGEIQVAVQKDGYYASKINPEFKSLSSAEVQHGRKWANDVVDVKIVLKQMHFPIALSFHRVNYDGIPATNEVVCLDLETFEWCPPYGAGKHRDLQLFYEVWNHPTNRFSYLRKLTLSMPNCVDGLCRKTIDSYSQFQYAYRAKEDDVYAKKLEYAVERRDGVFFQLHKPADDEYFIFRVRTETNEVGKIIHGHYGRIGEKSDHMFGLRMKAWFNQDDCDMNLEDATPSEMR